MYIQQWNIIIVAILLLIVEIYVSNCNRANEVPYSTFTELTNKTLDNTSNQPSVDSMYPIDSALLNLPKKKERKIMIAHIFVALCDNEHQGIIPVPAKLGNGQDADSNLYWGAMAGVKTWFLRQKKWTQLPIQAAYPAHVLDQFCAFQTTRNTTWIIIAQAYDGAWIRLCIEDFRRALAGIYVPEFSLHDKRISLTTLQGGSYTDLAVYIGHNGLMEFALDPLTLPQSQNYIRPKEAVVLSCKSQSYFKDMIRAYGIIPLILTTQLMAPEAYTLEAILRGKLLHKSSQEIHELAAIAYDQYQKCGIKSARKLFVLGQNTP